VAPVLKGKNILLGVTGSIAAYKSAEIVRELVNCGASAQVVMTEAATRFIGPQTLATLSGHRVITKMFSDETDPHIEHIRIPEEADAVLIAPATANTIARMAYGLADDSLSAMLLVARCPVLVAPAMNSNMYTHPAVEENVGKLKKRGVRIIEPGVGELACGVTGPGRLADIPNIIEELRAALTEQDLAGMRVLVTAGPTQEDLDPVRFISNRSSGKMGCAIARAAIRHGAEVTFVSGPTNQPVPRGADLKNVKSAEEMMQACDEVFGRADVLIMAAAVADYRPESAKAGKIKRAKGDLDLKLSSCPDILRALSQKRRPGQMLVGFAAETDDLIENARKKLESKGLDLLVANQVNTPDSGFDHDTNRIQILDSDGGVEAHPLMSKDEAAEQVIRRVVKWVARKKG